MSGKNPLELFLFTDEPARELDQDHLQLEPFSSMVAAAALTNRGPFNIGVFSSWGQGKTTVLRQAQALIQKEQERLKTAAADANKQPSLIITAWVNAWQYENEAHPIVPLLAIIIKEVTSAIESAASISEKDDALLRKTAGDLVRTLRSVAYGFSFKAAGITISPKDMIDRDEVLSAKSDPLLDQSVYYQSFDRLEKFCTSLNSQKTPPKIIVFIDDLDRCQPDKAVQLLESLKLILAQPGFIFVLAVDRAVIDSFLTKRYHSDFGIPVEKGHGKQYMDKIIQLPLDLPHHQNRFEEYVPKLIAATPSLPEEFAALFADQTSSPAFISALAVGCDRSPRSLIRTLNYLLTDLFLRENEFFDQNDDPFTSSAEFLQFAAISRITRIAFGSERERLYQRLVASEWGCNELCNYIEGKKNVWESTHHDPDYGYNYPGGEERFENDRAKIDPFKSTITQSESLDELFHTALGKAWLREHKKRQAVESYLATREDNAQIPDDDSTQIINTAIRETLDLDENEKISSHHHSRVTSLDLSYSLLSDLTPLQALPNIKRLNLTSAPIKDLSPLERLHRIERLDLKYTTIQKLHSLGKLTKLQILDLIESTAEGFDFISELENLRVINLAFTGLPDFTPFQDLKHIEILDARSTQVDSIAPLEKCTSLKGLYLDDTRVSDLSILSGLHNLEKLSLTGTPVTDLGHLHPLKDHLKRLWLEKTEIAKDADLMAELREALPHTNITPIAS